MEQKRWKGIETVRMMNKQGTVAQKIEWTMFPN